MVISHENSNVSFKSSSWNPLLSFVSHWEIFSNLPDNSSGKEGYRVLGKYNVPFEPRDPILFISIKLRFESLIKPK